MKKLFTIFVVGFLSFSIAHSKDTLTIVHFNDTHSCLSPGGNRDENLQGTWGGIARLATFVGMTKMSNPNTLVLHSGDMFIGDFFFNVFFGVAELAMLNQIGVDAMTVGNHEWDLTPNILKIALDSSGIEFPMLSANMVVINPELDGLNDYIKPYTVKQVGTHKVGIFGLTTPEANVISLPLPDVFIDTAVAEKVVEMVTVLKTVENCDVVIFLSHMGVAIDKMIGENIPGIDVIVGGHDHNVYNTPIVVQNPLGDDVQIVQGGAQYKYAGRMDLIFDNGTIENIKYNLSKLDKNIPEEPNIAGYVNVLIARIEQIYGPVYTKKIYDNPKDLTEMVMTGDKILETEVGQLVTKAFKSYTGTEIAIEPSGSTAQPLFKGPIVGSDVYRMISYGFNTDNGLGFRLNTFKMSGLDIFKGIEAGLAKLDIVDDYLIQASGCTYTYDMTKPPFQRVVSVMVNGQPLDMMRKYTITANEMIPPMLDYLGLGVDSLVEDKMTEYECVLNYLTTTNVDQKTYNKETVIVFPNPSSQENIVLSGLILQSGNYLVRIFDQSGRLVQRIEPIWHDAGPYMKVIKLDNLASGNYYFELTNGENAFGGSFVILK
jgi:5'-nucleotidase